MPLTEEVIKRFHGVRLTDEMKLAAQRESARREPDIRHHFTTAHYAQTQSDLIGFLGEFAFRVWLGQDWRAGIRPDYKTIDSNDVCANGWAIDVKTESIPARYLWQVLAKTVADNDWYGRRLYHVGQKNLVEKYDFVVLGAVLRENDPARVDAWFPIGWLPARQVLSYPHGQQGPPRRTGEPIVYPFAAYQITTRDLRNIDQLPPQLQQPRLPSER
jgi:hypothetical protein